jgi:molybdopterin molybdotransferase
MPKSGIVGGHGSEAWTGEWTYFFGLPGNPVSADVCFRLFVAPILRALSGRKDLPPRFVEATASEAFEGKPGLLRFLPAVMEGDWKGVNVRPVQWQGSGDVAANARATAYCVVPEGGVKVGEAARVLLR